MLTIARGVLANLGVGEQRMCPRELRFKKKMDFLLWVAISKILILYNPRCCDLWVNNKNSH